MKLYLPFSFTEVESWRLLGSGSISKWEEVGSRAGMQENRLRRFFYSKFCDSVFDFDYPTRLGLLISCVYSDDPGKARLKAKQKTGSPPAPTLSPSQEILDQQVTKTKTTTTNR